ncbi:MAG: dethiobiotin synthase [Bacteroidia bacterium]|nr:dethiobiotin synthase [Bacteroidia bacterium]
MQERIFVTGIGTGVGKTVISSILTCGLNAIYWKPVQAGRDPETDTETVKRLTGRLEHFFLPEFKILQAPESPHAAARKEGIHLSIQDIILPEPGNLPLVVEGAGGVLVPINERETYRDLMMKWNIPVVLVSRFYLGSINHTLLSIEALRSRNIPIKGIVFNGEHNPESERVIVGLTGIRVLGRVPQEENPQPHWVQNAFSRYMNWDGE